MKKLKYSDLTRDSSGFVLVYIKYKHHNIRRLVRSLSYFLLKTTSLGDPRLHHVLVDLCQ